MTLLPPAKTAEKSLLSAKNRHRLFMFVLRWCWNVWFSTVRKMTIGLLNWKTNRNSYALYRITLSDFRWPLTKPNPHFPHTSDEGVFARHPAVIAGLLRVSAGQRNIAPGAWNSQLAKARETRLYSSKSVAAEWPRSESGELRDLGSHAGHDLCSQDCKLKQRISDEWK